MTCACQRCCESKTHHETREAAGDAARRRWIDSRVTSTVKQCGHCWLWVVERGR